MRELEEWGAVFDRTKDGLINQRNFGGHRYPRLAHVGDRTGLEMIRALQDKAVHSNVDVHAECTAVDVLKDGDRVAGLLAYWKHTGRFVLFHAKALISMAASFGVGFVLGLVTRTLLIRRSKAAAAAEAEAKVKAARPRLQVTLSVS